MSGTPTEAEVQTQWKAAVNILEKTRAYADATVAGAGGLLDTLTQALEGEYLPTSYTQSMATYRQTLSSLVESARAQEFLVPMLFEYAKLIGFGSGYRDAGLIMRALYEHFDTNSYSIQSRAITYDTTQTDGGSNVGGGGGAEMSRLTVDENGYNLEACHVELKRFRCRQDQNSGADETAEIFECLGTQTSQDALLRGSFGSGDFSNVRIRSHHAGSGAGGSLLRNSSFSTYSASATPKFSGWTQAAGGDNITQDTTNYYNTYPNASTDASLKITGGGGTTTLKQTLDNSRLSRLDPDTPYFLRAMVNKTIGSASGGTFTVRLGSSTKSVTIAALGSGWQEVKIDIGTGCWFRNFNVDPFDIEIEWDGTGTSGYLLVDDVIFAPWDLIDGTYWFLRQNHTTATPWLVDDTLAFTDTGGAAGTGILQWWFWVSGLGYLPSSGSPTVTDPA